MPIDIHAEDGAYDPSPSELWNQDSEAKTTVGKSLFRFNTSQIPFTSRSTFGGASSLSYDSIRSLLNPIALDFFLSEGLVYFYHIIDTSNKPEVGFLTVVDPNTGASSTVAKPICGLNIGPDLGNVSSLPTDYDSFPTGGGMAFVGGSPTQQPYGVPGGKQAVKSTVLNPSDGRDASGRVGGFPELFCVDSSTKACMIQYLGGSKRFQGGETINWSENLGSSASAAAAGVGFRFTPIWSLSKSNFSQSAKVVEAYEMTDIGYTMLQLSGNFRFSADKVINYQGYNFKVVAGGGIPTRAALFGRWEFDQKEVYWIKMVAEEEYDGTNKIQRSKINVQYPRNNITRGEIDEVFNTANKKSSDDVARAVETIQEQSRQITQERVIATDDGGLTTETQLNATANIKDRDIPGIVDKDPIVGPIIAEVRKVFPETNESISAVEQVDRHLIKNVETTGGPIDVRNSPDSNARNILQNAGIPQSTYADLGSTNRSSSVTGSAFNIDGTVVDPRIDEKRTNVELDGEISKPLRKEMENNLDSKNQVIKEIFDNTLNSVNSVYNEVENAANSSFNADIKGKATKIYGPANRFDLVPKYSHPEYTVLQRYDPDGRENRSFNFNFSINFWPQPCGPCSQTTTTTPGDPNANPPTQDTTTTQTCSVAGSLTATSFPVTKVFLNNLTPEADIWKQICKNYSGSLQNITYGSLLAQSRGQSDSSNATEGQAYHNESTNESRIFINGQWQNIKDTKLSNPKPDITQEAPIDSPIADLDKVKEELSSNLTGNNKTYLNVVSDSYETVDETITELNRDKRTRNEENKNR